jgi:hypothetical protein
VDTVENPLTDPEQEDMHEFGELSALCVRSCVGGCRQAPFSAYCAEVVLYKLVALTRSQRPCTALQMAT